MTLIQLLSDGLRDALREAMAANLPTRRDGLKIMGLANRHISEDNLLLPELPPDAWIPRRYEGDWRRPLPGLAPEPTRFAPLLPDSPILAQIVHCGIYE